MPRMSRVRTSAGEGRPDASRRSSGSALGCDCRFTFSMSGCSTVVPWALGFSVGGWASCRDDGSKWRSYPGLRKAIPPLDTGGGPDVALGFLLQFREVGVDHHPHQFLEARARLPSELLACQGGVTDQLDGFGWPDQFWVDAHVLVPIEPNVGERLLDQIPDAAARAGGDHVLARLVLLEHQPHRLDEVPGEPPVAARVQVAQDELVLQAELD